MMWLHPWELWASPALFPNSNSAQQSLAQVLLPELVDVEAAGRIGWQSNSPIQKLLDLKLLLGKEVKTRIIQ